VSVFIRLLTLHSKATINGASSMSNKSPTSGKSSIRRKKENSGGPWQSHSTQKNKQERSSLTPFSAAFTVEDTDLIDVAGIKSEASFPKIPLPFDKQPLFTHVLNEDYIKFEDDISESLRLIATLLHLDMVVCAEANAYQYLSSTVYARLPNPPHPRVLQREKDITRTLTNQALQLYFDWETMKKPTTRCNAENFIKILTAVTKLIKGNLFYIDKYKNSRPLPAALLVLHKKLSLTLNSLDTTDKVARHSLRDGIQTSADDVRKMFEYKDLASFADLNKDYRTSNKNKFLYVVEKDLSTVKLKLTDPRFLIRTYILFRLRDITHLYTGPRKQSGIFDEIQNFITGGLENLKTGEYLKDKPPACRACLEMRTDFIQHIINQLNTCSSKLVAADGGPVNMLEINLKQRGKIQNLSLLFAHLRKTLGEFAPLNYWDNIFPPNPTQPVEANSMCQFLENTVSKFFF